MHRKGQTNQQLKLAYWTPKNSPLSPLSRRNTNELFVNSKYGSLLTTAV